MKSSEKKVSSWVKNKGKNWKKTRTNKLQPQARASHRSARGESNRNPRSASQTNNIVLFCPWYGWFSLYLSDLQQCYVPCLVCSVSYNTNDLCVFPCIKCNGRLCSFLPTGVTHIHPPIYQRGISESVNFDRIFLGQFVGDQKGAHVLSLVSLKLKHFAKIFVFNHASVATVLCVNKRSQRNVSRKNNIERERRRNGKASITATRERDASKQWVRGTHKTQQIWLIPVKTEKEACEHTFFEGFQNFLKIECGGQSLNSRQWFLAVTLLHSNMDIIFRVSFLLINRFLCEGVCAANKKIRDQQPE